VEKGRGLDPRQQTEGAEVDEGDLRPDAAEDDAAPAQLGATAENLPREAEPFAKTETRLPAEAADGTGPAALLAARAGGPDLDDFPFFDGSAEDFGAISRHAAPEGRVFVGDEDFFSQNRVLTFTRVKYHLNLPLTLC
jgi:hypothetical protein